MTEKVFVYGTLRQGQQYHNLIADYVKSMHKAKTCGILYDLPYGYPAMIFGDGCVCGEIFVLDDAEKALAVLDELENYHGPGEDNEYDRREIAVTAEDGSVHTCYVYVYPENRRDWLEQHGIRVTDGDWVRARKGNNSGEKA